MNWETAKEAIDFFWLHSIDSQQVNIGLYGGEPLLEFPLIKKIIEYSEQQFFGKKLTFSITTNATLLSEEMIFYFRDHDVSLMISLDGPKDINDKNRVFVNGEGTYETVIKHIELVKKVAPEYYKKLMISMVVDPGNDFDCINNAFVTGAKLDTLTIQPSGIDHTFDGQKTTISDDYSWKYEYQHFLAILSYFRRFPENLVSPIAMSPFASSIIENERVGQGAPLLSVDAPSGPCIPGKLRLFIDVNGKFYPCERVSEKSIVMNLGSIKDGFNFHKAYQIMNVGQLTESDCIQCWCFRYCIQCAKTADLESSELSAKARLSRCGEVRTMVYSKLYQYLLLNELPVYYGNQIRTEEEGKES
jgi:uncharacterized protein